MQSPGTDPADPIKAVEARMEAIAAPLTKSDGVSRFNELYLAVTHAVAAETDSYQEPSRRTRARRGPPRVRPRGGCTEEKFSQRSIVARIELVQSDGRHHARRLHAAAGFASVSKQPIKDVRTSPQRGNRSTT